MRPRIASGGAKPGGNERRGRRDRWVTFGVVLGVVLVALPLGASEFVGVKRCQSCHRFEFERWCDGPHAWAHRVLTPEQLGDPKCSTCHTLGPEFLEEELLGVQCERCHGSGKYYHRDYVMKDRELARAVGLLDVTAATCKQCHTAGTPSIDPFDFDRMWAEIAHGREARAEWEAAQEGAEAP